MNQKNAISMCTGRFPCLLRHMFRNGGIAMVVPIVFSVLEGTCRQRSGILTIYPS